MIPSDKIGILLTPLIQYSLVLENSFDSSNSDDLTAYNFYSHGVSSALNAKW